MEKKVNFIFVLSLQEIAMRRVAINLWTQRDILVSIQNFSKNPLAFCDYSLKWRKAVEKKVLDKLSRLVIPVSLSKQLLNIVTPIGLQISRWKLFHEKYLDMLQSKNIILPDVGLNAPVLEKLCWTATGLIDYRQTAKELIRAKIIDLEKRYRLACLYCLQDSIYLLWEELSEKVKRKYYYEGNNTEFRILNLPDCWPYFLKEKQSKLECLVRKRTEDQSPFNQIAFIDLAGSGNKVATDFFFQKLLNEDRNDQYLTTKALHLLSNRYIAWETVPAQFPQEQAGNTLCYLLSLMDSEQQMLIIQSYPIRVLKCFLDWPWHDVFLKILDLVWEFLSIEKYECLLDAISDCFRQSKYSYPKLFQECFLRSPIRFKKTFVDYECRSGKFFSRFFDIQDSETIKIVLRNTDTTDKVRLLSSKYTLKLFYDFILKDKWHMVKVCFREARLSKEARQRLREAFMEFFARADREQTKKNKLLGMSFLEILEESGEISQCKRNSEVETQNKAKKFCSNE